MSKRAEKILDVLDEMRRLYLSEVNIDDAYSQAVKTVAERKNIKESIISNICTKDFYFDDALSVEDFKEMVYNWIVDHDMSLKNELLNDLNNRNNHGDVIKIKKFKW